MRFPALAPILVLLAAAAPLRAGDTTYSETRAVPRKHWSSGDASPSGNPAGSRDGRGGEDGETFDHRDGGKASGNRESVDPRDRFLHSCMSPDDFESLGVGRWASRNDGRRFQRFEIRYQAAFLLPERRTSFPGDNTGVLHGLAWDWSWLW